MDQVDTTSQVSNITKKKKFYHFFDMFSKIKWKTVRTKNKERIKLHFFSVRLALYPIIINIIDNFVQHKNWIDTCDVRLKLYWECTNSTNFIVLESICPV